MFKCTNDLLPDSFENIFYKLENFERSLRFNPRKRIVDPPVPAPPPLVSKMYTRFLGKYRLLSYHVALLKCSFLQTFPSYAQHNIWNNL